MAKSTQDEENRSFIESCPILSIIKNFDAMLPPQLEEFFYNKRALWNLRSAFKEVKELRWKASAAAFKNITSKSFVAVRSNLKKPLLSQVAQNTLPQPQRLPSRQPRTRRTCSAWQHSGPPWGPRPRPDHWGPRCSSRPKTGLASSLASQESKITFLLQNF